MILFNFILDSRPLFNICLSKNSVIYLLYRYTIGLVQLDISRVIWRSSFIRILAQQCLSICHLLYRQTEVLNHTIFTDWCVIEVYLVWSPISYMIRRIFLMSRFSGFIIPYVVSIFVQLIVLTHWTIVR